MGCNVGSIVCLFVFNECWLYLGRGGTKWEKCPIFDENVRNMTQEAKPALASNCFTPTECVPGNPSVGVKQMWIFYVFGEVSNEALCCHGVNRKRRKTGSASTTKSSIRPTHDDPLCV